MSRKECLAIGVVLLWLSVCLATLAFKTGVTVDEPAHLLSAYLYWRGADQLPPGDMPPLIKIAGGWVPVMLDFRAPAPGDPVWRPNSEWDTALGMMGELSREEIEAVFSFARLPLILFPVATCVLLWWWGRQLFSPAAGVCAACLFALSPTVLGHGALFKNDLPASFAYLFFWYRAWVFWRDPGIRHSLWLALALLLGLSAKYSLFILAVLAPMVILLRYVSLRPIRWKAMGAGLAGCVMMPFAGVLTLWQYDFVRGIESLWHSNEDPNAVYLAGQIYEGGHPLYFLIALLAKVPTPTLVLLAIGAIALAARLSSREWRQDLFWLFPPALYFVLASISSLQLGFRLVLPAVVFLYLMGGFGCGWA
ncbi:MAG: glycosyltransferase family 39 protein, partial [Bryobacter sp.]|nr:glycosyltransferase family 39 protein [Bryobacter sp.]